MTDPHLDLLNRYDKLRTDLLAVQARSAADLAAIFQGSECPETVGQLDRAILALSAVVEFLQGDQRQEGMPRLAAPLAPLLVALFDVMHGARPEMLEPVRVEASTGKRGGRPNARGGDWGRAQIAAAIGCLLDLGQPMPEALRWMSARLAAAGVTRADKAIDANMLKRWHYEADTQLDHLRSIYHQFRADLDRHQFQSVGEAQRHIEGLVDGMKRLGLRRL